MHALAKRPQRPWLDDVLGAALVAAIVVAYTSVGQASPSTAQTRRTATVAEGVVQSTVSGSGTLQPASKVAVNFASSGTLTGVFVKVGEHVKKGELLAEVNPSSAESALRSAELALSTDEADYHDAVAGLTPAEAHQAEITADQSQASVDFRQADPQAGSADGEIRTVLRCGHRRAGRSLIEEHRTVGRGGSQEPAGRRQPGHQPARRRRKGGPRSAGRTRKSTRSRLG